MVTESHSNFHSSPTILSVVLISYSFDSFETNAYFSGSRGATVPTVSNNKNNKTSHQL